MPNRTGGPLSSRNGNRRTREEEERLSPATIIHVIVIHHPPLPLFLLLAGFPARRMDAWIVELLLFIGLCSHRSERGGAGQGREAVLRVEHATNLHWAESWLPFASDKQSIGAGTLVHSSFGTASTVQADIQSSNSNKQCQYETPRWRRKHQTKVSRTSLVSPSGFCR